MRRIEFFALAGLFMVALASPAAAQPSPAPGPGSGAAQVSASGRVHLQRPPTHLRMYMQVTGRGKTLEEALANLKERREAVSAHLQKLGAERDSIVFAAPGIDESAVAQQRRMEMMIAQRLAARGAKKTAKAAKPPVSMVSMLTVQWPLTADSTEKALLAAEALREKIKAADLTGGKDAPKLSPEEQEVADEMAAGAGGAGPAMPPGYEGEPAAMANEPRFVFLARLAPADRQKALADAFAKAKTQAAELAKAAGAELGPLSSISGEGGGGANGMNAYVRSPWGGYVQNDQIEAMQQAMQGGAAPEEHGSESLAMKPDGVSFDFMVSATFSLK